MERTLDSIPNFPLRKGILDAFTLPGPPNISALEATMKANWDLLKDAGIFGNFLENKGALHWADLLVDP